MKLSLKSLLDFPDQRPLTPDESHTFIACCMGSMGQTPIEDASRLPGFAIINGRLTSAGVDVDPWLILLCTGFSSSPAQAVMWAYTLTEMFYRKANGRLMILHFAEFFPKAVPTEKAKDDCWAAQKGDGPLGNLMDDKKNWRPGCQGTSLGHTLTSKTNPSPDFGRLGGRIGQGQLPCSGRGWHG